MPFSIWWLVPAFVGLVGVLLLVGGIGRVFKAKFLSGTFRVLFGGLTLAGAAIVGLVALNLQTYAQLTKERLAGQLKLTQPAGADKFTYTASIDLADNGVLRGAPSDFPVKGEHIRIEGPILKWKGWANVLGMDSIFRVDHVEGVYIDTNCQNQFYAGRSDMAEKGSENDAFKTIKNLGESWKLLNAVDVLYIDGPRVPMANGALYNIKATQAGFELEPVDQATKDLANTILSDSGAKCGPAPSPADAATPATPAAPVQLPTPAPAAPKPN